MPGTPSAYISLDEVPMLPLLLALSAPLAHAAAPPDAEALVAMPSVYCASPDPTPMSIEFRVGHGSWVILEESEEAASGPTDPAAPSRWRLERTVLTPATRQDRPMAPWQWTERVRAVGTTDENVVTEVTVACMNLGPDLVYAEPALFFAPSNPSPGQLRCRSRDEAIHFVVDSYVGGAPPPPDLVVSTSFLFVDGVLVGGEQRTAGGTTRDHPARLSIDWGPTTTVKAVQGYGLEVRRHTLTFSRADGSPLAGGKDKLTATLTCESVRTPPAP